MVKSKLLLNILNNKNKHKTGQVKYTMQILDKKNESQPQEIVDDLARRINNLTGPITEIREDNKVIFTTRNMTFATIQVVDDTVEVVFELPYDRILDMNGKCEVQPYATPDRIDIVTYKIKSKFDVQYAVSIAQQSYMYRKRLKL